MGALSFHISSDAVRPLRVYVTTTMDTRIGVFGCHSETVASLKKRIVDDHNTVHADVGEIEVYSLRATLNEYIFVAPDEITLGSLCLSEIDEELHISADVGVATKVIMRKRKRANLTEKPNSSLTDPVEKTAVGVVSANCDKELEQLSDDVVETSSANEAVDCNKDVEQLSMDGVVETSSANAAAVLTDGIQTMSSDPLDPNKGKQLFGVVPLVFESVNAVSEKVVIREQEKGSDDNLDVSVAPGHGQVFSTMATKENTFFPSVGKDNEMGNADNRSAERKKESQKQTSLSASAIHQLINVATNPEVAVQDLDVSQLIEGTLNDNKIVQTIQLARIEEQRDLSKNSQTEHIMTRVVEPVRASNKRKKSEKTSDLVNKIPEVPSFEYLKGISSTEQVSAVRKGNIECINEDSKITEKKCKKPRNTKKIQQCDFTALAKSLTVTKADNITTNQHSEKKSQSKEHTAADIPPTDHVGDLDVHAKVERHAEITNINDKSLPTTGETETIINHVALAGLKSASNLKKIKKKVGTSKLIGSQAGRKAQSTNPGTTQKENILLKTETKNMVPPSHKKLPDSSASVLEKSVLNHEKVKKIVDTPIMNENQAEGKAQSTDSGSTFRKKNTLLKDESTKKMMPPSSKKVMDSSEKGLESNKSSRHNVYVPQELSGHTNADALFKRIMQLLLAQGFPK